MEFNNRLNRTLQKLKSFPKFSQRWFRNKAIGRVVPFVGTAGLDFEKMTCEEVIVNIPNRKKVQNHISQVHAAASVLLAETASGMVLGMNVPDDKLPLMKSLGAKFIKRSTGAQKAIATLTSEQINLIRETEKGDVNVAVKLIDSTGKEVVVTEMIWAWVPKKEK
jgi:acyl-coenzyme A thioesterase PaaI-like protein